MSLQGGDPREPAGYGATVAGAALIEGAGRRFVQVVGRAPGRMFAGLLSGSLPPEHRLMEGGLLRGRAPYSALLTPKGRILTDLRIARLEGGEEGRLLLDLPESAASTALERMRQSLPPRFARIEETTPPLFLLTLVGPEASTLLGAATGQPAEATGLATMEEGDELLLPSEGGTPLRIVRGGDAVPPLFDLIGSEEALDHLRGELLRRGAVAGTPELRELLRIEKGRPAFGTELDEETIPPEAGIENRAIDHRKGCYTGQEVIVRIRDRGKVNRRLRGLLLGDQPLPVQGTPLFSPEREGAVGEIRSRTTSPRFGQGIALGYLRREVEPPASVRVGGPDGPMAEVRALDDAGWALFEGDTGWIA